MSVTNHEPSPTNSTEFTATYDTGEHFNGYTLLVEAYAALWLILMAWLVLVWKKQVNLASRVAGLESAIARAASRKGEGAPTPEKSGDRGTAH
jgi:hypothetical protein